MSDDDAEAHEHPHGRQASFSAQNEAITQKIAADGQWLKQNNVHLTKWGPDPGSGKVKIYLTNYSDQARDLLMERYGDSIIVASGSWPRPRRVS